MASDSRSGWAPALRQYAERFRQSLFLLPAICLVGALILAQLALTVDDHIDDDGLPSSLVSTVGSARAVLGAIATGTITAATLVLTLTLVAVQLASSQFSPRTLRSFLGDRFQQWVIGLIIGTVAYTLLVLRVVQTPPNETSRPEVPNLSVALGVVLAIASLFAVLASIDHTARSLRVGAVADSIVSETKAVIDKTLEKSEPSPTYDAPDVTPAVARSGDGPSGDGLVVRADRSGWVQQLDDSVVARVVEERSTVYVRVAVGSYVVDGMPLAIVEPAPGDGNDPSSEIRSLVRMGDERSMQQDIGFGLVRLVDIALRALSPGINDPNTADEIIVRLGDVFVCLYERPLRGSESRIDGRIVVRSVEPTHDDYLNTAFDPIRRSAADHPAVLATMIRTLDNLRRETLRRRPGADVTAIDRLIGSCGTSFEPGASDQTARALVDKAIDEARSR